MDDASVLSIQKGAGGHLLAITMGMMKTDTVDSISQERIRDKGFGD